MKSLALLSIVLLLAGCSWLDWIVVPKPTAPPPTQTPCVWQWANQLLPEVTTQLTDAMAQLPGVTVSASAFGENCLNVDGTLRLFAAIETDYTLSLPSEQLAEALTILVTEAQQGRAGTKPGRITLTIDTSPPLQVPFITAATAFAQGLRGDALVTALHNS